MYAAAPDGTYYVKQEGTSGYPAIYADLTEATGATINMLRLAFATQKFLEIQARGGSRYIEVIKNHFNVTSPDARLQRPEYLVTDTNVQRTLAVASEPQFIFDSLFKLRCTRPMPVNSIPGGTHF